MELLEMPPQDKINEIFTILRPAIEFGIEITLGPFYDGGRMFSVGLNTGAKSSCDLVVEDGVIIAKMRYGETAVIEDFRDVLAAVHSCGHRRSYFAHDWLMLLEEEGFKCPLGPC